MRRVSVSEARASWPKLLASAEAGEEVIITRHGRPVAHLAPASGAARLPDGAALRAANPALPKSAGELVREMRDEYRY